MASTGRKGRNSVMDAEDLSDSDDSEEEEQDSEVVMAKPKKRSNNTNGKLRGNAAYKGQPAHLRKASVLNGLANKISDAVHGREGTKAVEMDGWVEDNDLDQAKKLADTAVRNLREASDILNEKGSDFVPVDRRLPVSSRVRLVEGAVCRIKDKFRSGDGSYEDLMDEEEMDNLVFQKKRGTKLLFKTSDGGKIFLKRSEIDVVSNDSDELDI